jgi:hypothetical protein
MSETPMKVRARVTRDAGHMRRGLAHKMRIRNLREHEFSTLRNMKLRNPIKGIPEGKLSAAPG